jgi:hypothetical protein
MVFPRASSTSRPCFHGKAGIAEWRRCTSLQAHEIGRSMFI